MCKFFSFLVRPDGTAIYFDSEARRQNTEADSHSNIAAKLLSSVQEDRCNKYEYTSAGLVEDSVVNKDIMFDDVKAKMKDFAKSKEFWKICVRALSHGTACLEMVRGDKRAETEKIIHEFACWSAEQSLVNYEKQFPNDNRVRKAIETKRLWSQGKATDEDLSAAESAARSAAWSARSDAESAQQEYLDTLMEQVWPTGKGE